MRQRQASYHSQDDEMINKCYSAIFCCNIATVEENLFKLENLSL